MGGDINLTYLFLGLVLNKVIYELACFTLATDIDNKYYTDKTKRDIENTFKETLNIK